MSTVKEVTLINKEYVREYSPIPLNYNLDEVMPYTKVAELLWIKPIIGDALYCELLDEVEESAITDANSTLLLKIYQAEGIAIVYEALPFIYAHVSEVGITKGKSDNSDSINLTEVDYLTKHLKAQLQARLDELKYFLKTHSDSYPLWEVEDECCKKPMGSPFQQIYKPRNKRTELK